MIPLSEIKKNSKKEQEVILDINCDLGQSYGVYTNELEKDLIPFVSSVNISCGAHSGDPITILKALNAAKENNLAVGAHIGFPDIQGFGYREMQLDDDEIEAVVLYQIGALSSLAKARGQEIEYVRCHGALYKQAVQNEQTSITIAKAIAKYNPWLIYVTTGINAAIVSEEAKIRVAKEIFLDKKYNLDGSIDLESGDIVDYDYSCKLLNSLVKDKSVINNQGGKTKVDFDTIHLNMKSNMSIHIAKKTQELIKTPRPVGYNFTRESGWVE